jgi:hypothetical protein
VEGDQENKTVKKPSPPLRTSQGTWARSNVEKACTFTQHLANIFQLHPSENDLEEEEPLMQLLEPPINHLKRAHVQEVKSLNSKIPSGYNLITGIILK